MSQNFANNYGDGCEAHCDDCGRDFFIINGITAIYSRGYWWCAHCVKFYYVAGEPVVDFPSPGKLIPETILEVLL